VKLLDDPEDYCDSETRRAKGRYRLVALPCALLAHLPDVARIGGLNKSSLWVNYRARKKVMLPPRRAFRNFRVSRPAI
jgi:hypothetical protein